MMVNIRINEVNIKTQEQRLKYQSELYCNFLKIASNFLCLKLFSFFLFILINVGGGFFYYERD